MWLHRSSAHWVRPGCIYCHTWLPWPLHGIRQTLRVRTCFCKFQWWETNFTCVCNHFCHFLVSSSLYTFDNNYYFDCVYLIGKFIFKCETFSQLPRSFARDRCFILGSPFNDRLNFSVSQSHTPPPSLHSADKQLEFWSWVSSYSTSPQNYWSFFLVLCLNDLG
jgi:hypothetical protein